MNSTKRHSAFLWAPALIRISNFGIRVGSLLFAWSLTSATCHSQTGTQHEYEIKQGVLSTIIQYVEWPAGSLSNLPPVIQIGLLGQIPFADVFLQVLDGKIIHDRRLAIKKISLAEAQKCHVVFIGESEKHRLAEIIDGLDDRPILTVSEVEGFPQRGGMVNLLAGGNHVSLEVNPKAATRVGLNIGSEVLSRAKLVGR